MIKFKGVYSALVSPFTDDDKINYDVLQEFVEHQIKSGISGVVLSGTTGESPTLSQNEFSEMLSFCKSNFGQKTQVIAGSGSNSTRASIDKSIVAAEIGVDAVMIVTPYYNKPSQKGLFLHYSEIAKAVYPTPVIIYNVPSRTQSHISCETVLELRHLHDNISGIKDASCDLNYVANIKRSIDSDFQILCGEDSYFTAYLNHGASGIISVTSNAIPELMVKVYDLFESGKIEESRNLLFQLNPVIDQLFIETNPMPIKYLIDTQMFSVGKPRLPMHELSIKYRNDLVSTYNILVKDHNLQR